MSYHNTPSSARQSTTNTQGQTAPTGFHYMPDGTLMSDVEHARLYGGGIITGFNLDFSNIKETGETRSFSIVGQDRAIFSLEIKNEDNYYYNFQTHLFQATKTKLGNIVIESGAYSGNITFPTVTDADQYDFYLFAEQGTIHGGYKEVKFSDGSVDINSSTGSNSNLLQKVIYQTLEVTLTLSNLSPTGDVASFSNTNQVITTSAGKDVGEIQFEIKATVAAGALSIDRQPLDSDIIALSPRVVGAAPINIPGEDLYPAVTETDVVNGDFSAGVEKIVMDTNVADKMVVGDKITTAAMTDTVDGAIPRSTLTTKVVMDTNVALKMAIGDAVTGTIYLDKQAATGDPVTVYALDPDGDNAKEFSVASPIQLGIDDGATLTFNSKLNRELITVAALNPDSDNVKEFSPSTRLGVRDNATLSFSNQRNYRWPVDSIDGLREGMRTVAGAFFGNPPTIKEYLEEIISNEGEENEIKIEKVKVPPLETLGAIPVITRDAATKIVTTAQAGNITFSEQALLGFGGTTANIYSYGLDEINRLSGYDVEFSNLNVVLNDITTTTSAAVSASTTIPVASKVGIVAPTTQTVDGAITSSQYVVLDSVDGLNVGQSLYVISAGTLLGTPTITAINETTKRITLSIAQTFADGITLTFPNSIISGIGIDPGAISPYVASIASLNLTASAAQTLEDDQTFAFTGVGNIATITGSIKINYAGSENQTIYFDLDKFLTRHTN
jgi:hypothetical protein